MRPRRHGRAISAPPRPDASPPNGLQLRVAQAGLGRPELSAGQLVATPFQGKDRRGASRRPHYQCLRASPMISTPGFSALMPKTVSELSPLKLKNKLLVKHEGVRSWRNGRIQCLKERLVCHLSMPPSKKLYCHQDNCVGS
jgi:hypothetical protein